MDMTLYFQMVGSEPTDYFESLKSMGNYNNVVNEVRSRTASTHGTFTIQLAKRLRSLFDQTNPFSAPRAEGLNTSTVPDRNVAETDLLCYVCAHENNSVLQRFDRARYLAMKAKHPNAAGVTANIDIDGHFAGILSEIWLSKLKNDITAATFAVYHEWMHNKTNWLAGEDPDWVHRVVGGGLSEANDNLTGLTPASAAAMGKRLWMRNQQFLRALPI